MFDIKEGEEAGGKRRLTCGYNYGSGSQFVWTLAQPILDITDNALFPKRYYSPSPGLAPSCLLFVRTGRTFATATALEIALMLLSPTNWGELGEPLQQLQP
ncbi:hypothetical protein JTB14_025656 [Gonioctena quinquepunctata]|nr:hypothetical protein JTB14_025656 [Gonioctena quinquepunctata]